MRTACWCCVSPSPAPPSVLPPEVNRHRVSFYSPGRNYPCYARHRFASGLFNANVPEGVVSMVTGRSRGNTATDVYLEVLSREICNIRGKLTALWLAEAQGEQEDTGSKQGAGQPAPRPEGYPQWWLFFLT